MNKVLVLFAAVPLLSTAVVPQPLPKRTFSTTRASANSRARIHPAVLYDIGASNGVWSETIMDVCPSARFHLFEPLAHHSESYAGDLRERLARRRI